MQLMVIVGPNASARRYVRRHQLDPDTYMIVTTADRLHAIDPVLIGEIVTVDLRRLRDDILDEIRHELEILRRLWTIRIRPVTLPRVSLSTA